MLRPPLGKEAPEGATTTTEHRGGLWAMQNKGTRLRGDDSRRFVPQSDFTLYIQQFQQLGAKGTLYFTAFAPRYVE